MARKKSPKTKKSTLALLDELRFSLRDLMATLDIQEEVLRREMARRCAVHGKGKGGRLQ